MTSIDACETCPLNVGAAQAEISDYLRFLFHVENLQAAGAPLSFNSLTPMEWTGLSLLKSKRNEKQINELKKK